MLNIPRDFREFIELLNKNSVRYLIVGGYAVAFHGLPRSTGDIDFFFDRSIANARLITHCLQEFGFDELDITPDELTNQERVIQIGYPPLRIDLLSSIDGVGFDEAWMGKIEAEIDGVTVHVISREHLIKNKRISGRGQDKADIDRLETGE
ncbi:MAG: hypothetical protein HN368_06445 [Spirochaetales bacterium]|nr:hypothetical protein [Spirochaetales bacterium]